MTGYNSCISWLPNSWWTSDCEPRIKLKPLNLYKCDFNALPGLTLSTITINLRWGNWYTYMLESIICVPAIFCFCFCTHAHYLSRPYLSNYTPMMMDIFKSLKIDFKSWILLLCQATLHTLPTMQLKWRC